MSKPAFQIKTSLIVLLLFFPCSPVSPQNKASGQKPPKTEPSQPVFKIPVDVVVVSATVTDQKGEPVLGLTVDDFTVYEDGKPQPIHTFALESYKSLQATDPAQKVTAGVGVAEESEPTQPRLFSIVIDDLTTAREHYYPVTQAVRKFVEETLLPGDQVAIVSGSGRVQHPFTTDKQLLHAALGDLYRKLETSTATRSSCPVMTDLQAQRIASGGADIDSLNVAVQEAIICLHMEDAPQDMIPDIVRAAASGQVSEAQYRNRALLRSLRQHIRSLKHFEAKKNLILFSDGFLFEDLTYELQDIVDQALRAGVVLNAVDARGLYVGTFEASDNLRIPYQLLMAKQRLLSEDVRIQGDPLNMMAHDTGGIFHQDSNDLHAGLKRISERQTHFYVLTYAAPSQKADGRYHRIKLEVSRPGLQLSYRKGYYAPKEQLTFERRRKEDILEALQAPGNVNQIPIRTGYVYYRLDESRYEVELLTQVDIRRMQFVEEDSRRRNLISLVVVALDDYDRYVDGLQKDVTFNLTPSGYSELLSRGFASKVVFRVPAGRYKIKTVVRESSESKMGSVTRGIEIP
jgi:VWFA-related protein